jgi:CTP synthase
MTRFIFITGGVVSSLGKGITAASLGALLQAHGYRVRIRKMDPYLNVDPGTMSPLQHGEVFVTDDGAETDLDLGHYERFTGVSARRGDNWTAGRIYQDVITRERKGGYLGATVQVIPHITDAIKAAIVADVSQEDFVIVEIGGTVGDIESLPFLEAIRQLANDLGQDHTMFVHVTLLPWIPAAGELKTKPTQHSVRELLGLGIAPQMLVCRTDRDIPDNERKKISLFCNVRPESVISAKDVNDINEVPLAYHAAGMDHVVLTHFGLDHPEPDLSGWERIVRIARNPSHHVRIGVVGKYTDLKDSYKSLAEALAHGGLANDARVDVRWLEANDTDLEQFQDLRSEVDGVLVPGGFGSRGISAKIRAIRYARINLVPFLGICLGMQLAVIESYQFSGWPTASSTEFGPCDPAIVDIMPNRDGDMGGTMRLGSYAAMLAEGSLARRIYGAPLIHERHRHRYEVIANGTHLPRLGAHGLRFSGMSPDGRLPEIIERPDHPWFIGVQFHPELKSRPLDPHPLFASFIKAAMEAKS